MNKYKTANLKQILPQIFFLTLFKYLKMFKNSFLTEYVNCHIAQRIYKKRICITCTFIFSKEILRIRKVTVTLN